MTYLQGLIVSNMEGLNEGKIEIETVESLQNGYGYRNFMLNSWLSKKRLFNLYSSISHSVHARRAATNCKNAFS